MSDEWDYIYKYTRKNAVDDGVLVDISDIASEYGFKINTCMSSSLFLKHFYDSENEQKEKYLLSMFLIELNQKIIHEGGDSDRVYVDYLGEKVVCHIGPGDDVKPVITICYPNEL